jgi:hypothetical protein
VIVASYDALRSFPRPITHNAALACWTHACATISIVTYTNTYSAKYTNADIDTYT